MRHYELTVTLRKSDKATLLSDMAAVENLLERRKALRQQKPSAIDAIRAAQAILDEAA
jgi:hypothetical protein